MPRVNWLLSVLLVLAGPVLADKPTAKVTIKNAVIKAENLNEINTNWNEFLQEDQGILMKYRTETKKKNYKVDQYCKIITGLLEDNNIDFNSLKVVKHKGNYAYNLQAIDFLRQHPFQLSKKKPDQPVTLEFIYQSF